MSGHLDSLGFNQYQRLTSDTAVYPSVHDRNALALTYTALGLAGEAGECADVIKKVVRDDGGVLTDARRERLEGEIGDALWYLARLADEANITLLGVAMSNLAKLRQRKEANELHGR